MPVSRCSELFMNRHMMPTTSRYMHMHFCGSRLHLGMDLGGVEDLNMSWGHLYS